MCLAATSGASDAICETDLPECVAWNDRELATLVEAEEVTGTYLQSADSLTAELGSLTASPRVLLLALLKTRQV